MAEQSEHSITRWLAEVRDPGRAQQAWDRIAERLYPVSAAKARRRGLKEADAESVGQLSLMRLFQRLESGQVVVTKRGHLFGLFAKIARNTAADRVDRNQRLEFRGDLFTGEVDLSDETLPRWLDGAEPTLEEEKQVNLLERRFHAAMTERQRSIFELKVDLELDVPEIAAKLGISKETVYRGLDELADIIRAISEDSELAWLRDERETDEVGALVAEMQRFLDSQGREAQVRWLTGEAAPAIAKALGVTPTRTYAMLSHLDDVIYVLRRRVQLSDLRAKVVAADDPGLRDELKEIIKKRKWPVFEAWVGGKDAGQLVADGPANVRDTFAVLRAIHESARAIRRVL